MFPKGQKNNPFSVPPSFHFWAPWIGRNTRRSDCVLDTEFEKIRPAKAAEVSEITVSEDRLRDELCKQKVKSLFNVVMILCCCPIKG